MPVKSDVYNQTNINLFPLAWHRPVNMIYLKYGLELDLESLVAFSVSKSTK